MSLLQQIHDNPHAFIALTIVAIILAYILITTWPDDEA
jgi:hypothetical protein